MNRLVVVDIVVVFEFVGIVVGIDSEFDHVGEEFGFDFVPFVD